MLTPVSDDNEAVWKKCRKDGSVLECNDYISQHLYKQISQRQQQRCIRFLV